MGNLSGERAEKEYFLCQLMNYNVAPSLLLICILLLPMDFLHSGFINYSIIVKTVFVEESKNGGNLALSKKNILIFQIGNSS